MHPLLFRLIPLYFVMWGLAAVTCIGGGSALAARTGFPRGRSALALTLLAVSILAGSKLLYLLEASWFPFDDYVPWEMRGTLHGFRIPGGILVLAVATPLVCGGLGIEWRRFGDAFSPLAALALVFIRLGCFLNGCCFGKVSSVPWAVSFPPGTAVFWYHRFRGWIPPGARSSLPVHPLQLYFLLAAMCMFGLLVWQQRRAQYPGHVQLLFYTLFFGSTAALEPLRQNYLTLNNWITSTVAAIAGGVLLRRALVSTAKSPGKILQGREQTRTGGTDGTTHSSFGNRVEPADRST